MNNIGLFLINILFDLYTYVLILRLLLQLIRADYRNPLSQFTIKFTQHALIPFQKFIPTYRNLDLAVVCLIILVQMIKYALLIQMLLGQIPNIGGVFMISVVGGLEKIMKVYFYAIIIKVIMSWVAPMQQSPITFIINRMVEPLLKPMKKIIPPLGGFDLSPVVALILLQVASLLLLQTANHILL